MHICTQQQLKAKINKFVRYVNVKIKTRRKGDHYDNHKCKLCKFHYVHD